MQLTNPNSVDKALVHRLKDLILVKGMYLGCRFPALVEVHQTTS